MHDKKYKNIIRFAKDISTSFTNQYGSKVSRSLYITGAAATASTFIAVSHRNEVNND